MLRSIVFLLAFIAAPVCAQQRSLADFFRDFTDEWMRGNPNQAAATRYFSGAEQTSFERQLTPRRAPGARGACDSRGKGWRRLPSSTARR